MIEKDIQNLIDAARHNDLSQRIELPDKSGFFDTLSSDIKGLVDVNEQIVNGTITAFSAMAKGDLSNVLI